MFIRAATSFFFDNVNDYTDDTTTGVDARPTDSRPSDFSPVDARPSGATGASSGLVDASTTINSIYH